jgi:hypothetical protein
MDWLAMPKECKILAMRLSDIGDVVYQGEVRKGC